MQVLLRQRLVGVLGLVVILFPVCLKAQWVARVVDWRFGFSQTSGQSSEFFPQNVIGPTDPAASRNIPSSDPRHVCSLGRGGWIILEFDPPIANGAGADFIVFENAFEFGNGRIYDEWMQVEVSDDGLTWQKFPYDSLTGEGFAGRTPTEAGAHLAIDPARMGGDAFDLDIVDVQSVRFMRLTDATRFQSPDRLGAELDAAYAIHQLTHQPTRVEENSMNNLIFDPHQPSLVWIGSWPVTLRLFSLSGQVILNYVALDSGGNAPLHELNKGIYIVELTTSDGCLHRKKIMFN